MEKVRRFWPYVVGAVAFGLYALALALGWLGNLDTGCGIAGQDPEECGSIPVIEFLINPPAWFLGLSFLIGVSAIAYGERKERDRFFVRVKKFIELEGRVAVLENTLKEDDRRSRQDIAAFSDKIDEFSGRFAELQEGFDKQTAAANETISAAASELGKVNAERWKERYLEMQDVTIQRVVADEWARQLDAGHYVNRVDSVECQIDRAEKSLQQLAQRVEYLADQVDAFAHQMKVRDDG